MTFRQSLETRARVARWCRPPLSSMATWKMSTRSSGGRIDTDIAALITWVEVLSFCSNVREATHRSAMQALLALSESVQVLKEVVGGSDGKRGRHCKPTQMFRCQSHVCPSQINDVRMQQSWWRRRSGGRRDPRTGKAHEAGVHPYFSSHLLTTPPPPSPLSSRVGSHISSAGRALRLLFHERDVYLNRRSSFPNSTLQSESKPHHFTCRGCAHQAGLGNSYPQRRL